jgi:hypothetical protein
VRKARVERLRAAQSILYARHNVSVRFDENQVFGVDGILV